METVGDCIRISPGRVVSPSGEMHVRRGSGRLRLPRSVRASPDLRLWQKISGLPWYTWAINRVYRVNGPQGNSGLDEGGGFLGA